MKKATAIIQARMNSSRLPGKILKDIAGRPMLAWVVERARLAATIDEVWVATTDNASDDAVEVFCRENGYPVYRGSQFDVLDRFYQAALLAKASTIVRITADCPLIDPAVVDRVVAEFWNSGADFAANRLPPPWQRTFPIGLDVEVVKFEALERAWCEAIEPYEREHVMPYLYDKEGRFKVVVIDHDQNYGSQRWTVDTPEDLVLLRRIFAAFPDGLSIRWQQVLALVEQNPDWVAINAGVRHKTLTDVDHRVESNGGK